MSCKSAALAPSESIKRKKSKVQTSVQQTEQKTNQPVQGQMENVFNVDRGNRGNNFDMNDNVLDNNVGNENVSRGRGGNIIVNDVNFNSNPVANDTKKTVSSKPVIEEYQGLDFKPSGLSGRDYSNGGKLKKGQKNFPILMVTKHKKTHEKRPNFKKVKHHTSKCAKW
jgi:hypothetical protein